MVLFFLLYISRVKLQPMYRLSNSRRIDTQLIDSLPEAAPEAGPMSRVALPSVMINHSDFADELYHTPVSVVGLATNTVIPVGFQVVLYDPATQPQEAMKQLKYW